MNIRKLAAGMLCALMLTSMLPASALALDAAVTVRLANNNPNEETLDPGEDNVVFMRLELEADDDIEVDEINFTAFGDFDTGDVINLELVNGDTGAVLDSAANLDGTDVSFGNLNLSINHNDEVELELRGDIADTADNGNSIGFKISDKDDLEVDDDDGDRADVNGGFPIRGEEMSIGFDERLTIRLGSNNPGDQIVDQDTEEVTFMTIRLGAGVDVEVNEIIFTAFGDFDDRDFDDFRLIDLDTDEEIGDVSRLNDNNELVFNDDFGFEEDEEIELALIGDVDREAQTGSKIGFKIDDADDITAEDEDDGQDLTADSSFPIKSNDVIVGSSDSLAVDISDNSPDDETHEQGDDDVTVLLFTMSAPEDLEVKNIRFDAIGDYNEDDVDDFRLINTNNGDTLDRTNDWSGDGYVEFDDGFDMEGGETITVALQLDIDNDATGGSEIGFKISQESHIEAEGEDNGDNINIEGDFPIESELITIALEDGLVFSLSSESPEDKTVVPGEENVTLLVFRVTAGRTTDINEIKFTAEGDFDEEDFEDFELIDLNDDDDDLAYESEIDGKIVQFEDDFEIRRGKTMTIALIADVATDAEIGNDIRFELARASHVEAEEVTSEEDPDIIGDFPIQGEDVEVSTTSRSGSNDDEDEEDNNENDNTDTNDDEADIVFSGQSLKELPRVAVDAEPLEDFSGYENPFPDTDLDSLAGKAAAELYRRGILSGNPDGEFKGENLVNRAEAAKILMIAKYGELGDAEEAESPFTDVAFVDWFYKFVMKAHEDSIIEGYEDKSYRPANNINTAEFLKMISLTYGLGTGFDHTFEDFEEGVWFSGFAGNADHYVMFPDRSITELEPARVLTRNEVAVAIYQYLLNK